MKDTTSTGSRGSGCNFITVLWIAYWRRQYHAEDPRWVDMGGES